MQGEVADREQEVKKEDDEVSSIADIADAHIQQTGLVAVKVKDGEMFIFTDVTLRQLLKQAESNPTRKVMVFIPTKRQAN